MRLLRKAMLLASGILALIYLVGLFLAVVTLRWSVLPGTLLRLALWTALCVYLIRRERRQVAPPSAPDPGA